MAKRRDVELRIRARDLGTRSLDQLNAALGEINEKLVKQRNNADLAATSTRDLAAQQKALAAAVAELAGRRGALEIFEKQQKSAEEARAEVNRLRAELAELLRIKSQGTFLGDIDKAVKTVRRELDQATGRFDKFNRAIEESRSTLNALGVDTADLAGEFRKVDAASEAAAAAVSEVTGQIGRQEQAVAELRAEEERRLARQREIAAEVKRRASVEEAAAKRQLELARQFQFDERSNFDRVRRVDQAKSVFSSVTPEQINARRVARLAEKAATDQQSAAQLQQIGVMRRASAEGERLASAARGNAAAQRQFAQSTRQATNGLQLFADTGRKSLSVYQRLRGQVLGLVTAYVGLFETINQGRRAVEVFTQFEGIESRLRILTDGDAKAAAGELEFLRQEANRLGIDLVQAANGYARFAVSAKLAGVSTAQIRDAFSGLSEVTRVLRLSADDTAGVFRAVDQIISKGQLSAEELRQQLGERIPGAFNQAAKAAGFTAQEFDKLLKKGGADGTDALFKFIEQYRRIVAGELPTATKSLQATFARLSNAYNEFLLAIAEGGLAEELEALAKNTTEFLKSSEGKEFARDIVDVIKFFGAILRGVTENFGALITIAKIFIGLQVAKGFIDAGRAARGFVTDLRNLGKTGAGTATTLQAAAGLAFAAWTGWQIGTYLKNNFIEAELAGIALANGLVKGWERVKASTKLLAASIQLAFRSAFKFVRNTLADIIDAYATSAEAVDLFGLSEAAIGKARGLASSIRDTSKPWEDFKKTVNDTVVATEKAVTEIDRQFAELADAAINKRYGPNGQPGAVPAPTGGNGSTGGGNTGVDPEIAEARVKLEEETQKRILEVQRRGLEARLDADENDLEARIALINMEFDAEVAALRKLQAEAKAVGAQRTADALAGVEAQVEALRRLEIAEASKANIQRTAAQQAERLQEDFNKREKELNRLLDERRARLELIQTRQELGQLDGAKAAKEVAQVEADLRDRILKQIADLRAFVNDPANKADLSKFLNIEETLASLERTKVEIESVLTPAQQKTRELAQEISGGLASSFRAFAETLVQTGFNIGESFVAARDAFRNFAADFLVKIGEMILQAALFKTLFGQDGNSGLLGGALGGLGKYLSGLQFHDGGVVGAGGKPRMAMASWFASAPRFHNGGLPGLKSNEVPAILQKGEEVLTRDDPRNVLNGGAGGGGSQQVQIINTIDSASVVEAGLKTAAGRRAIVNAIRADKAAFKAIITS